MRTLLHTQFPRKSEPTTWCDSKGNANVFFDAFWWVKPVHNPKYADMRFEYQQATNIGANGNTGIITSLVNFKAINEGTKLTVCVPPAQKSLFNKISRHLPRTKPHMRISQQRHHPP